MSFVHEFERQDLMNKGDKVFTITYLLGYALTNSHHSIDYMNSSSIKIDDLFQEIGSIKENHFCDVSNDNTNWVLDISKNKNSYEDKRIKNTTTNDLLETSPTTKELVRSISKRIDSRSSLLNNLK